MKIKDCKGCPHLKEVTDGGGKGIRDRKKYYRKYCLLSRPLEIYGVKICPKEKE